MLLVFGGVFFQNGWAFIGGCSRGLVHVREKLQVMCLNYIAPASRNGVLSHIWCGISPHPALQMPEWVVSIGSWAFAASICQGKVACACKRAGYVPSRRSALGHSVSGLSLLLSLAQQRIGENCESECVINDI